MSNSLPKIEITELVRLGQAGVIEEIKILRRQVVRAVDGLSPSAILALAMSRHAGTAPAEAFNSFRAEVAEFLATLRANAEAMDSAIGSDKAALAPMVAAAASRELEIVELVAGIDSRVASNQSHDLGKRDRLVKAGLTGSELETASAPTDNSQLLAEREALLAEGETLQRFLQSRDMRDLPTGFALPEAA